jgi:RecD/TraA family predicted helicase|nr:MAG TPA: ATP dependent DNA helicase [Caudoviricetes sp.]
MSTTLKCHTLREVFINSDKTFRVVACAPLEQFNYPLNKYGNFTLTGNNLNMLSINKDYTIEIVEDEKSKYDCSYKLLSIKGVELEEDKIIIAPELRHNLLMGIMTDSQATNVLNAYPDFIELILNGQEQQIDYNKIYNVGPVYLKSYITKVKENFNSILFVSIFHKYGITDKKYIDRISSVYTLPKVAEERMLTIPYEFLIEITEMSFEKADDIILSKINPDLAISEIRLSFYLDSVLKQNENEYGDTKLDIDVLYDIAKEYMSECCDKFFENVVKNTDFFIVKDNYISRASTYSNEKIIAEQIKNRVNSSVFWTVDWKPYTTADGFTLTEEQTKILQVIGENNIGMLVGQAGTGKSASVKAVIKMLEDNEIPYLMLAPTGIAAKRLRESTGRSASTIHRLIKKYENSFGDKYAITSGVVIIDEMSMVGVELLATLLQIIGEEVKLLFVCDNAQLASISCGNIVEDILNSGTIPTVKLTQVFRYGKGGIDTVATDIRNGNVDNLEEPFSDYVLLPFANNFETQFINLYQQLLSEGYTRQNIMILSPFNVGSYGTKHLNKVIQDYINQNRETCFEGYRISDKVINTKNNYKMPYAEEIDNSYIPSEDIFGVMNGDIGYIIDDVKINNEPQGLIVEFDEGTAYVSTKNVQDLDLGYAISVHKSQGSQSDVVIVILHKSHESLLSRNLIYVGITRAKKKLILISNKNIIKRSLSIQENKERDTWLYEWLKEVK